jgi:hypothetical protein
MRESAYRINNSLTKCIPSDNHRSIVTLCFPTVTTVPGGSVPAGTFLVGRTVDGAERDVAFERLAREEVCEEYGDAILDNRRS